jgi:polyhydroxyalkanoate synthesis regulator phasin
MAKFRNATLAEKVENMQPKENLVAKNSVPNPNTTNLQGFEAYSIDNWLRLISLLNTSKLENQYYRNENDTMKELKSLVDVCGKEDPYFVAQCIVYSRCIGEGMRSINHLAAVYLAPYMSGKEWSKRFFSGWDKKGQKGGTVFRPDDMSEMAACFTALNGKSITNAMKKGFASTLEKLDTYSLLKYKSSILDLFNLVHPNQENSKATVEYEGKVVPTFEAIVKGYSVSADTWEVAQSDAGQVVAKAVKEGKLSETEAKEVLTEAKAENWKGLLTENKLGILAAVRNIRNILLNKPDTNTIDKLCSLLSDDVAIKNGKVMPYQLDMANEVLLTEFNDSNARKISQALLSGYEKAIPNLAELLSGNNLVMIDMSGSMGTSVTDPKRKTRYTSSCLTKASLIGMTIAKAVNADVIRFGSNAEYVNYNPNTDVFSLAKSIQRGMGGTSLSQAWNTAKSSGRKYDRVFILSDNECNIGSTYSAYKSYVEKVGDPYVYSIDLASYGTVPMAGPKVRYYYGYGYGMFDDIAKSEFNPMYHIEKIRKVEI